MLLAALGYTEGGIDNCRSKSHTEGAGGPEVGKENSEKSPRGSLPVWPEGAQAMFWTGVSQRLWNLEGVGISGL